MSTKYYVQLSSGKYLTQPPVQGRRNLATRDMGDAYNFGAQAAQIVARGIKGACVVSAETLTPHRL